MPSWLRALLVACWLSGCGSVTEVRIQEAQPSLVADHEVAVIEVNQLKRFRNGKRVEVMAAILVVRDKGERRKLQVAQGDDVIIGSQRFLVTRIEAGTASTAGVVTLQSIE